MKRSESFSHNGVEVDVARKKRLGQYFSGRKVARLLAALSNASSAESIIDPMGGTGDMLSACAELGGGSRACASIDIDPRTTSFAREQLASVTTSALTLLQGNAFEANIISRLPTLSFDLVITNPPYVRYQSISNALQGDIHLPNAVQVRNDLLSLIGELPNFDEHDRDILTTLVSNYSGLSDLAVPSWFLCALLTSPNGTLALVVPEAWLTRDYALVVQYLLLRWFRVRFVVEDTQAIWFPDALVKTTLIVAHRTNRRDSVLDWGEEGYLHVRVGGQAANKDSIVGNLFPSEHHPETAFAQRLEGTLAKQGKGSDSLVDTSWIPLRLKAENLKRLVSDQRWFQMAEGESNRDRGMGAVQESHQAVIPNALSTWLGRNSILAFTTLGQLGVEAGQGLRTGANQFFYIDVCEERDDEIDALPNKVFGIARMQLPSACALPVLRNQSEVGSGFCLDGLGLKGRVLALQDFALPEDLESSESAQASYATMPDELAQYVRTVGQLNIGEEGKPRWIPRLSAVRTNVRHQDFTNPKSVPRFWYMLPPFTTRHKPDLFVARVNSRHPKTMLNAPSKVLVDANFSTLWLNSSASIDQHALLAVLNSSVCVAAMELVASVMGGGALKLEATHLRHLPIPALDEKGWKKMSDLGQRLTSTGHHAKMFREIDTVILKSLFGSKGLSKKHSELRKIMDSQLRMRNRIG